MNKRSRDKIVEPIDDDANGLLNEEIKLIPENYAVAIYSEF
ncbi:hypothetical protein [Bacillus sp. FJAT-22090]|nr:hypothetical protein [Bacillus sp. FJAT-22090]